MLESISDCPRNFTTIQCGVYPVNRRFPQNFQMISTLGIGWAGELHAKNQQQIPHRAFSPIRNDMAFWRALTTARNSMSLPSGVKRRFRRAF
jgi:hypothetical protein